MARLYFSFKAEDREQAIELADVLKSKGHELVLPVDRHIRLAYWRQRLVEALKSSDGVIVLLSKQSVRSHYVISEIGIARALDDRMFLIPAVLDDTPIPDFIQDLYVVSWKGTGVDSLKKLADEIDEAIKDHYEFVRATRRSRIFIGHGRSEAWRQLKDFLHERLKLPWDEFNREPMAGEITANRLQEMLDQAALALLVLTAEDKQEDGTFRARQNVIHEVGLFQGRLGFKKAIVLVEEGCESFSNVEGVTQIRFPRGKLNACFEDLRLVFEREGLLASEHGKS